MDAEQTQRARSAATTETGEDTALRVLSKQDRAKLSMDSWEPSLLRNLLKAQNRQPRKR